MTLLVPQRGAIPAPQASPMSEAYWDGIRQHQLRFQRCADCGGATHTPALVCSHCGSRSMSWEVSAGQGTITTWTTVFRPPTPEFVVPYVPIVVDLSEGWQMLSCLVGCEHDAVTIGQEVRVEFHDTDGGVTLPYFRPA